MCVRWVLYSRQSRLWRLSSTEMLYRHLHSELMMKLTGGKLPETFTERKKKPKHTLVKLEHVSLNMGCDMDILHLRRFDGYVDAMEMHIRDTCNVTNVTCDRLKAALSE